MNTQGPTLAVRPNEKEHEMEIWGPWIEWAGGECPIPLGTEYEICGCDGSIERYICDEVDSDDAFGQWRHEGDEDDITAYRTKVRLEDLIGRRVEVEWSDPKCDWPHFVLEAVLLSGNLRLQGYSLPDARYEGGPEYARPDEIRSISAVADEPKTNTTLILQGSLDAPAMVHVGTWEPAKPEQVPSPKCVRFVEVRDGDTGELLERAEGENAAIQMRAEWIGRNTVGHFCVTAVVDEPAKPEEPKPAPEGWKLVNTEGRNETWEKRDGDRVERVFKFNEDWGDFECSTDGVTPRDVPGMHAAAMREIEGHIPEPAEPTREAPPLPIAGFDHRLGMWK